MDADSSSEIGNADTSNKAYGNIKQISCNLFKRKLNEDTVAAEMQAQGVLFPSQQEIKNYSDTLEELLRNLKQDTKNAYKQACVLTAQRIDLRRNPEKRVSSITKFADIGLEFMRKPTWENARDLFHCFYSSTDAMGKGDMLFKKAMELQWLENNNLTMNGPRPVGRIVTGVQYQITDKVNNVRKEAIARLSSLHKFKVLKSIPKDTREETNNPKRRKILRFEREFIVGGNNKSCDDFDLYLQQIHKNKYEPFAKDDFVEDFPTFEEIYGVNTLINTKKKKRNEKMEEHNESQKIKESSSNEEDDSNTQKKKQKNSNSKNDDSSSLSMPDFEVGKEEESEESEPTVIEVSKKNIENKKKELEKQQKFHEQQVLEFQNEMKKHQEEVKRFNEQRNKKVSFK